jgi:CheY-like chemotaxis protein
MRVLIADDDPDFCAFVLQALEGTEFEAEDISGDAAASFAANAIFILDEAACELRLADASRSDQIVIATVADGDVHALDRALLRGADDAIYKPLAPRALVARLTVARHRLITSPRTARSPRSCLDETLAAGTTGSIVIRGALHSGAIHVHDGAIAWVESAGRDVSLTVLLGRFGIALDPDTALAVIGEARQTGQHFTEVLAEWGLVDRAVARDCLRSYLADEVATLLSDLNASVLFMPYDRRRASSLGFLPADILPTPVVLESGVVPASSGCNPPCPASRWPPSAAPWISPDAAASS